MSKRKIPLKSDVKRMPNWPGEQINPQAPNSQGKSSGTGSPLPYQGSGFEGRWQSVQDLFDQLRQRGASTKGDKAIQSALSSMANANNLSNSFFELLGNLGINIADQSKERTDQLFQYMLQAGLINDQRTFDEYLKNDQRQYDWAMKQEQRQYDNPQNELARLMGAGISRDAALQMLSGSAGNIGGAGASSVPYGSGTGISAPSQLATSGNQDLAIANTVLNGVQAFMQLVQSGVGVAEGIEQVQAMQAQNYWNSEQMQSYDAVKQVGTQIEQLKASGVLDDDTISSWKNLEDMQVWLDDHADTNGVAPLVQSGALKRAFGTPFGRQRMTNFYSDVIKGRSEGEQVDNFLRQQDLNNQLSQLNITQGYFDYNKALSTLSDELELFHQQVRDGEIQIKIHGEEFKGLEYENWFTEQDKDILDTVLNQPGGVDGTGQTGKYYMSMDSWLQLYDSFRKSQVWFQNGTNNGKYEDMLQNNAETAYNVAFVKALMSGALESAWNPDKNEALATLMQMGLIFQSSGLMNAIQIGYGAQNAFDNGSSLTGSAVRGAAHGATSAGARGAVRRLVTRKP